MDSWVVTYTPIFISYFNVKHMLNDIYMSTGNKTIIIIIKSLMLYFYYYSRPLFINGFCSFLANIDKILRTKSILKIYFILKN